MEAVPELILLLDPRVIQPPNRNYREIRAISAIDSRNLFEIQWNSKEKKTWIKI